MDSKRLAENPESTVLAACKSHAERIATAVLRRNPFEVRLEARLSGPGGAEYTVRIDGVDHALSGTPDADLANRADLLGLLQGVADSRDALLTHRALRDVAAMRGQWKKQLGALVRYLKKERLNCNKATTGSLADEFIRVIEREVGKAESLVFSVFTRAFKHGAKRAYRTEERLILPDKDCWTVAYDLSSALAPLRKKNTWKRLIRLFDGLSRRAADRFGLKHRLDTADLPTAATKYAEEALNRLEEQDFMDALPLETDDFDDSELWLGILTDSLLSAANEAADTFIELHLRPRFHTLRDVGNRAFGGDLRASDHRLEEVDALLTRAEDLLEDPP